VLTVNVYSSRRDNILLARNDFRIDANNHSGRHAIHYIGIARLADSGDLKKQVNLESLLSGE
jgi:hypothetical protein